MNMGSGERQKATWGDALDKNADQHAKVVTDMEYTRSLGLPPSAKELERLRRLHEVRERIKNR